MQRQDENGDGHTEIAVGAPGDSDDATRQELSERFLAACDEQGVPRPASEHIWVQMAKFNAYSFCKAHAASCDRGVQWRSEGPGSSHIGVMSVLLRSARFTSGASGSPIMAV